MKSEVLISIACAWGLICSDTDSEPVDPPDPPSSCDRQLAPAQSGLCNFQSDTGSGLLIQGDLILPSGLLEKGEVLVDDGQIVCTGCDCSGEPAAQDASLLSCPGTVVSPGLINGRVSSTFSTAFPYSIGQTYTHRHGWRTGAFGEQQLSLNRPNTNATDNVKWEEVRAVMAGSTSGVTSGGTAGMLRNLDRSAHNGFDESRVELETFPLSDSSGTVRLNDCNYPDLPTAAEVQGADAYVLSLAQGTRAEARNEFLCLSGAQTGAVDVLESPAVIVGGVALNSTDIASTVAAGTRLVWTPRNDTALYNATANVPVFKQHNASISLGTDWVASGSANMLRELACADQWNDHWGGSVFTPQELVALATSGAANNSGFGAELGSLEPGKEADITLWDASSPSRSGYEAILQAGNEDVALVLRAGVPLYGNEDLVTALAPADGCETVDICGESRQICAQREFGETLASLIARNNGSYPLFTCGSWANEPSCTVD